SRLAGRRAVPARRARLLRSRRVRARAGAATAAHARTGRSASMRYVVSFARFWWDFVVGDDWRLAAGVAAAIGLTSILTHSGVNAWWLLPAAVALLLTLSLRRATR